MEIVVKSLSKKYGNFLALDNVNFAINGKKCVGYLGPNGAGKTTTLKLLTHLLFPTKGDAEINGYSVTKEYTKALKHVGALVENPNFYPYLTPRELLSQICHLREINKRDIDHVLELVGMDEWKNKKVGKFSKGMKQRIALAVALIGNPDILILDEPTTGMDPQGMAEVRQLIKKLKKEHLIFMSSHLLSEVQEVCDEVIMLNRGKMLLHDKITVINRKFVDKVVIVEFADTIDKAKFPESRYIKEIEMIDEHRIRISISGGLDAQAEVLKSLISAGYRVVSYKPESIAIERAYMKLIGGDGNE